MVPSDVPSQVPSDQPSTMPSDSPSGGPNTAFFAAALSDVPSMVPSDQPSSTSSDAPSAVPIAVARATVTSDVPSLVPSDQPTTITSNVPSDTPSTSFATEPLPTSGSILGFTLVNADTREELMAFEDGDTISLSSVNTTFLSLRADTDESVVDKVRFSFEGIENTEGEAPYALFGKRGGGSYIAVASLAVPGIKTLTVEAFDKNDEVVDDVWMSFNVEE